MGTVESDLAKERLVEAALKAEAFLKQHYDRTPQVLPRTVIGALLQAIADYKMLEKST